MTMINGRNQISENDPTLALMKRLRNFALETHRENVVEEGNSSLLQRLLSSMPNKRLKEKYYLLKQLWDITWKEILNEYASQGDASCVTQAIAQLLDKQSPYHFNYIAEENAKETFLDVIIKCILSIASYAYVLPNILVHYPKVFHKLQKEADGIIGVDHQMCLFDLHKMPYTMATVHELLRYCSLFPMCLRKTLDNTSIGGYAIPKDTTVLPLYSALHYDKTFWGDPRVFRPERFLAEDGSFLPDDHLKRTHLMPFGSGVRACLGENFALMHLLIFVTTVVQSFDILPGNDFQPSCNQETFTDGAILSHPPYTVKLKSRQISS